MAASVGRQSVVAVLDVRGWKGLFTSGYEVWSHNCTINHKLDPIELAKQFQDAGVGEILVNSVDRDGMMQGYDLELATQLKQVLKVPLTILGGAGSLDHLLDLFSSSGLVGAAAGSLFVFKGKYRAVLISYPSPKQKRDLFKVSPTN
jgi:cyclase